MLSLSPSLPPPPMPSVHSSVRATHKDRRISVRGGLFLLTVSIDIVGQEEVELPHGDVDVVGVDAEARVEAVGRLLQPLSVCALQRDCLEEDHLHQV